MADENEDIITIDRSVDFQTAGELMARCGASAAEFVRAMRVLQIRPCMALNHVAMFNDIKCEMLQKEIERARLAAVHAAYTASDIAKLSQGQKPN